MHTLERAGHRSFRSTDRAERPTPCLSTSAHSISRWRVMTVNAHASVREMMLPQAVIVGIASEYSPLLYNAMIAAGAVAFVRTEDMEELLFRTIVFTMCTYHPAHVNSMPVHVTAV